MMIILKNQHPTLTERYLFKTYGLYRSISDDQEHEPRNWAGSVRRAPIKFYCRKTLVDK